MTARMAVPLKPRLFRWILIPTDLSDRTAGALDIASRMPSARGTRLTLLHVIQTIPDVSVHELRRFYRQLETRAFRRMSRFAARVGDGGHGITQEVVYGSPAREIVRFATAHKVDLIVLPSHPVDLSLVHRGWGTVSYKVGIMSRCPVLLVK